MITRRTVRRPIAHLAARWRSGHRAVVAVVAVLSLVAAVLAITAQTAAAAPTLLSRDQPATASSIESASYPASAAVDGNLSTRWSSAFSDPQWLQVDLGATASITQVVLYWETAYAKAFQIQTSPDGPAWTSIFSPTPGTGGTQPLSISGSGRYIRMYGTARGTGYGYSLWEFQVFAPTAGGNTVTVSNPGSQTSTPGTAGSRQITPTDPAPGQTLPSTAPRPPPARSTPPPRLTPGNR